MSLIAETVKSQGFVEKALLLLLTALLSGIIVPLIISYLNISRARNEAILDAQSKLWEEISAIILIYETLALDVSWFKTKVARNDDLHEKAFTRYTEKVVDLVAKWRTQAARAQTLVSPAVSQKIDAFLLRIFNEQDTPLNALHTATTTDEAWQNQHKKNIEMLQEANKLIEEIAKDIKISKESL